MAGQILAYALEVASFSAIFYLSGMPILANVAAKILAACFAFAFHAADFFRLRESQEPARFGRFLHCGLGNQRRADLEPAVDPAQANVICAALSQDRLRYRVRGANLRLSRQVRVPVEERGTELKTAAVTGASGFIGKALVAALRRSGWNVVALSRTSVRHSDAMRWELGQELPLDVGELDCVFHLASATLVAATGFEDAEQTDIGGTQIILQQLRRARASTGRPLRFVFVSSQSAKPGAVSAYGRSKWQIETLLDGHEEVIVRPGLVFGPGATGAFEAIAKLIKIPILPRDTGKPAIQPIHVDDLANALVRIAEHPDERRCWCLGDPEPMRLGELFDAIARKEQTRAPLLLPIPSPLLAMLARGAAALRPSSSISERVLGLIALTPFDAEELLQRLGMTLRPIASRRHTKLRRNLERAHALLVYVGASPPAGSTVRRLARVLGRVRSAFGASRSCSETLSGASALDRAA